MQGDYLMSNDEFIGFCYYCKEEIKNDKPFVIYEGNIYHSYCFNLLQLDKDLSDFYDIE